MSNDDYDSNNNDSDDIDRDNDDSDDNDSYDDTHRVLVDAGVTGQKLLVHQVEHHAGLGLRVYAHSEPEQRYSVCRLLLLTRCAPLQYLNDPS